VAALDRSRRLRVRRLDRVPGRAGTTGVRGNDPMSDLVKVACIAAVTVLVVVGMLIYFSPYHSCVRDNVPASICVGGLPSSK
jgi:hypothetical protein